MVPPPFIRSGPGNAWVVPSCPVGSVLGVGIRVGKRCSPSFGEVTTRLQIGEGSGLSPLSACLTLANQHCRHTAEICARLEEHPSSVFRGVHGRRRHVVCEPGSRVTCQAVRQRTDRDACSGGPLSVHPMVSFLVSLGPPPVLGLRTQDRRPLLPGWRGRRPPARQASGSYLRLREPAMTCSQRQAVGAVGLEHHSRGLK